VIDAGLLFSGCLFIHLTTPSSSVLLCQRGSRPAPRCRARVTPSSASGRSGVGADNGTSIVRVGPSASERSWLVELFPPSPLRCSARNPTLNLPNRSRKLSWAALASWKEIGNSSVFMKQVIAGSNSLCSLGCLLREFKRFFVSRTGSTPQRRSAPHNERGFFKKRLLPEIDPLGEPNGTKG
jgi:hypothetical protein